MKSNDLREFGGAAGTNVAVEKRGGHPELLLP
jgi:hypothetical protein